MKKYSKEIPTGTSSLSVIWMAMLSMAPFWTRIGNGSTLITSKVKG